MRTKLPHLARTLCLALVGASLIVSGPGAPSSQASMDQACSTPTQRLTMYAEQILDDTGEPLRGPDGRPRLGWATAPGTASTPGPLIEMYEGECIAITVHNNIPSEVLAEIRDDPQLGSRDPAMPLGVSLHVHGVKYTTASDGTLHTDSWVEPGATRTYWWYAAPRVAVAGRIVSQGTAGYWWFHDHVIGTDHGTGGVSLGLYGGLVVRRPGDLEPDRSHIVGMGPGPTIDLRTYPDTVRYEAREGERVEFLVVGLGDEFHTFHLHGHSWVDNRTGTFLHQADETRLIDTKTVGPAETFGFQIVAGEDVGPGAWMLHCHVQFHSDAGMVTFLDVLPGDGRPPPAPAVQHQHFGRTG